MTNTLRTKKGTPIIPLPKTFSFIQNGITEFDSILSLFKWKTPPLSRLIAISTFLSKIIGDKFVSKIVEMCF